MEKWTTDRSTSEKESVILAGEGTDELIPTQFVLNPVKQIARNNKERIFFFIMRVLTYSKLYQ